MSINSLDMLVTINTQMPNLILLATAIMYVIGMYIIVVSIASMRNAPTISTPGQGQVSMWTLIKHVLVGAALIYLPSTVSAGTATLFSETVSYAYVQDNSNSFKPLFDVGISICLLIGVIAVGRGIYELGFGNGGNSQEKGHKGALSKGLMHIIAGCCLINLETFLVVVFMTLGINGIIN